MYYLYASLIALALHLIIRKLAGGKVTEYLLDANALIRAGKYTDGCTTPFKNYIHEWLNKSHDLCAAHDYGSLGFITGVRPGWHNNLITWFAHMTQHNPVYWVWGTIVVLFTLPWVVWRRNLGIEFIPFLPFHIIIYVAPLIVYILLLIQPYFN